VPAKGRRVLDAPRLDPWLISSCPYGELVTVM